MRKHEPTCDVYMIPPSVNDPRQLWTGPMPFKELTKVQGDPLRHIEQLWDEIKKLKERVKELENE